MHRYFGINFANSCFRKLLAGDKYSVPVHISTEYAINVRILGDGREPIPAMRTNKQGPNGFRPVSIGYSGERDGY